MEKPSAFFIAQQVKNLPLSESINKTYPTAGKRRKSMISQGYTLCEVYTGKPGARLLKIWALSTPENPLRESPGWQLIALA